MHVKVERRETGNDDPVMVMPQDTGDNLERPVAVGKRGLFRDGLQPEM